MPRPLTEKEYIATKLKQIHDIVGSYNRFDVFRLTVDQRPNRPITVIRDEEGLSSGTPADAWPSIGETPPGASNQSAHGKEKQGIPR
jgi:hypothetical protein